MMFESATRTVLVDQSNHGDNNTSTLVIIGEGLSLSLFGFGAALTIVMICTAPCVVFGLLSIKYTLVLTALSAA
jgi:hypothetical protein